MKSLQLAALVYLAMAALIIPQAMALSEDDKSMNSSSGAAKFSDPDEQMPAGAVYMSGPGAQSGNVDPSSVRYDYDAASGSYVPSKQ